MSNNTLYPNTFQHHNAYVDLISHLLTGNEEKVLNHVLRHIMGWEAGRKTRSASIAISVLTDGIVSSKTGERLSHGCGLSDSTVRKTLGTLCDFGIITRIGDPTHDGQEYALQLEFDALDWDAMETRRSKRDARYVRQMAEARKKNPRLYDDTPPVQQNPSCSTEPPPSCSTEPPPSCSTGDIKPMCKLSRNPSGDGDDENQKPRADFEQLFGRAVAVEEKEPIDWTDPEARNARLMDAMRAFYGNAPDVSDAARARIRARDGIEASTLLEVHAELIEAGLSEPGSDAGWREWRPMLVAVYQECGGDLSRVNVAAQAIAERGRYAGRCSNWHNVARDAVTEAVEVGAPGMSVAEALR